MTNIKTIGYFALAAMIATIAAIVLLNPSIAQERTNKKVVICHVPPGNPDNAHTIEVSENAVDAHLAHGDYLGACTTGGGTTVDEPEATVPDSEPTTPGTTNKPPATPPDATTPEETTPSPTVIKEITVVPEAPTSPQERQGAPSGSPTPETEVQSAQANSQAVVQQGQLPDTGGVPPWAIAGVVGFLVAFSVGFFMSRLTR